MNDNSRYFHALRRQAGAHLPADFAQRVIRESDRTRRGRVHRIRLIAVTGILCAAIAISIHLLSREAAEQSNLEIWAKTAAQAQALEVWL